jgi:lipoate-protein ligase A
MLVPIENLSTDPAFNLAFEEYVHRRMPPQYDYLVLWQNAPAVIVGRFQNTIEEVNQEFVESRGIRVVRRRSGGGAVYHDLGNLNFTMVVRSDGERNSFQRFLEPVAATLRRLGVPVERTSRNDLSVEGKKFSGNAQFIQGGRLLHHGTILFDANLDDVQRALHVDPEKVESHGVKSVRSRVTNLRPYLPVGFTLDDLRLALIAGIAQEYGGVGATVRFAESDLDAVRALREERYARWEWNYGDSPRFSLQRRRRFAPGIVDVRLDVSEGRIRACRIYGDFFGQRDVSELEAALVGCRHRRDDLADALRDVPVEEYLGGVTRDDLTGLLSERTAAPQQAG